MIHPKEKDDAVSPVIALMLILAILATCMAVYTTTYVPGLKQQDEITHSGEVKFAFMRFASDIDNTIAQGKPAVYTEVLELGGGDVPLSPSKSSGTVEITEKPVAKLTIGESVMFINTAEISYIPSFTSWEPQGYLYRNGVVWITKDEKITPASLQKYRISDGIEDETAVLKGWFSQITTSQDESGNGLGGLLGSIIGGGTSSKTSVIIPQMKTGTSAAVTGSGIAKLKLQAETETKTYTETVTLTLLNGEGDDDDEIIWSKSGTMLNSVEITWLNIEVSVE